MEEFLQQSGSQPDLAVQSFSSLLTTQQPSTFLKLLSSPSSSAGHLQKTLPNSAQTNLHFYDSRLQYSDYNGDFTKDDNILFFEYDDNDQPSSGDLSLVDKLTDRQGKMANLISGFTIKNLLFQQMRICLLVVDLAVLVVASVRQHS